MSAWKTGAVAAAFALGLSGCASQMTCQRSSDPLEAERCMQHGSPAEAVVSGAGNAVIWGTAGCSAADCNPPYVCDAESGLCERAVCGEGNPCPPAFECDLTTHRCR